MMRALWNDEGGFIVSTELVLVATILVIAMVVGLSAVRDAVLTELADLSNAIGAINQSFTYNGVTACNGASAAGSSFTDAADECDTSAGSQGAVGDKLNVHVSPSAG
jgi:hypothetical protein